MNDPVDEAVCLLYKGEFVIYPRNYYLLEDNRCWRNIEITFFLILVVERPVQYHTVYNKLCLMVVFAYSGRYMSVRISGLEDNLWITANKQSQQPKLSVNCARGSSPD